jgi:hypothetical protein
MGSHSVWDPVYRRGPPRAAVYVLSFALCGVCEWRGCVPKSTCTPPISAGANQCRDQSVQGLGQMLSLVDAFFAGMQPRFMCPPHMTSFHSRQGRGARAPELDVCGVLQSVCCESWNTSGAHRVPRCMLALLTQVQCGVFLVRLRCGRNRCQGMFALCVRLCVVVLFFLGRQSVAVRAVLLWLDYPCGTPHARAGARLFACVTFPTIKQMHCMGPSWGVG